MCALRRQRAYRGCLSHLIISISEKMIEPLDPNEAEARILHVGHDVERHGRPQIEPYVSTCSPRSPTHRAFQAGALHGRSGWPGILAEYDGWGDQETRQIGD
jgi:hypothetical protein